MEFASMDEKNIGTRFNSKAVSTRLLVTSYFKAPQVNLISFPPFINRDFPDCI
jgi:hypothetical protein